MSEWSCTKNNVFLWQTVVIAVCGFFAPALLGLPTYATIDPNSYAAEFDMDDEIDIDVVPVTSIYDVYVSAKQTITVNSTGLSEYKIFANIPSNLNGNLNYVGGSTPYISQVSATPSTATTLGINTWGFGIPSGTMGLPTNSFSSTYIEGVPASSSTYSGYTIEPSYTLIRTITNATGADTFDVYYGVRLDNTIMENPGTYQTNIDYHIVANASNVPGGEATITPISGPKAGGDTVTITTSMMADFIPSGISVTLGGQACTSPSTSIATGVLVITCTTPAHYPGAVDVVVNVSSLGLSYTIPNGFTFLETGSVELTNVQYVSGINVKGTPNPTINNDGTVDFDLTFLGGEDNTTTLEATYRITITNTTSSDYTFTAPESNLALIISNNERRDVYYSLRNIAVGDTILAGSSVTFDLVLSADYVSGEHGVDGEIGVAPMDQDSSSILGTINGSNVGDLSGSNTLTAFSLNVESTFDETKSFTIDSLDPDFEVVDSTGAPLGNQTIAANTTGTYTFYLKKAAGASFASETATAGIVISYDTMYVNCGEVQITVDRDPGFVDSQSPVISGVTIDKNKTVSGEATVSWSGSDNVGIASYSLYKCTTTSGCDNPITNISGLTTSYTFTGLSPATYYFVVVGYDDVPNTASQSDIDDAIANRGQPGPASASQNTALTWTYSVSGSITNGSLSHTSGSTVTAGGTYQGRINPNSGGLFENFTYPESITVQMDGRTLTSDEYSYTSSGTNAGTVRVPNASGNITITATCPSSCLLEGTIIALADGTNKPIEQITYHDLLKVWDYETGSVGAEYPAWIEKERKTVGYQLAKFSDGTELKTFGWHGVFDADANEFISVDNPERFYVGVNVYKVVDDELVPVTVESIEYVREEVSVYHVVSAKYYNVIANDLLTTDGTVMLSNLYGFEDNIKWPELRNEIISNPDNLYTYADFEDIGMPRRMFDDLRVAEGKYLYIKYGMTLDVFKYYLVNNQLNPDMWLPYDD